MKVTCAIKIEEWYKAFLSIKEKLILFVQFLNHIAQLYPVKSDAIGKPVPKWMTHIIF